MADFRNQIVGVIRFSLVTTDYLSAQFKKVDDVARFVFDEERLERRFRLFEEICWPALEAQESKDLNLTILTSDSLPDKWMNRLRDRVGNPRWAQIRAIPPAPVYRSVREAFHAVPTDGYTHRTTFRLDDDDGVDHGYVKRLKQLCRKLKNIPLGPAPLAVAFNRGLYVEYGPDGTTFYEAQERMPLSIGCAIMAPVDYPENVYLYNHRSLGIENNTYMERDCITYLRSIHRDNKSKPHFSGTTQKLTQARAKTLIKKHFGLDAARLATLF